MLDAIILTLGAFRLFVLVAEDTLTEGVRQRILGYDDDGRKNHWPADHRKIGEFIHCPWCVGFWISLATVAAWHEWPHATRLALAPFALSAAVALIVIAKNRAVD